MADLENLVIQISVSRGTSLGKVRTRQKTWRTLTEMFAHDKLLVDTACTFAQYKKLSIDEQGQKKRAAGNWMPALFKDGKRKGPNQLCRTMVVFDLDYVSHEQLDHIRLGLAPICRFAWFMHTTRGHCPEKPRVRLIVPVDREMTLEECNALTRYLATELADDPAEGIEIPDLVSMKANQVMYLPSISRDQEYWTDRNDADLLHVDAYLAEHPHWQDHALLPYKESESSRAAIDPNRKMEDPREKQGYIGAFCRTYTVEDAIAEFIPEVYAPGASSGSDIRYTYLLGSGVNGAVVYDDGLFIYSNHGTDPIEGAANAWDMVRIHKFGHLDKDAPANTLIGNLPSSKAMMEFARKDPAVSAELHANLIAEMDDAFDDEDEDDEDDEGGETADDADPLDDLLGGSDDDEDDLLGGADDEDEDDLLGGFDDDEDDEEDDILDGASRDEKAKKDKRKSETAWMANFRRKANGDLEPVLNNIALICENDPRIARSIGYNEFTADPVCLRPIKAKKINTPSRALRKNERKRGRRWEDKDDAAISLIASGNARRGGYETDFADAAIQKAVLAAGAKNPIHPVKDYLEECHRKWIEAGRPRGLTSQIPQTYLGCPDTPFHRESSEEVCVAAVARIYEPGCKFDQITVFEGATGAGKSTFIRAWSGDFFSEFRVDLDRVDRTVEAMRGNWFLEIGEMAAAKKADSNVMKDFLSSPADTVRLAYGKREITFPRQSIMFGTSNEDDYLTDPTSVRRNWVWRVQGYDEFNRIDVEGFKDRLPLIWGEAVQTYWDRREEQPEGDLHLGLKTPEAIREQRTIAEGSRRQTATEAISEAIREWLDKPVSQEEAEAHTPDPVDLEFDDEDDGGARFIRNMVTAKDAFVALRNDPTLAPYRNADVRTYGKALKLLDGWTELGQVRRHGRKAPWLYRQEDGPMWVPAPEESGADEPSIDDLLG